MKFKFLYEVCVSFPNPHFTIASHHKLQGRRPLGQGRSWSCDCRTVILDKSWSEASFRCTIRQRDFNEYDRWWINNNQIKYSNELLFLSFFRKVWTFWFSNWLSEFFVVLQFNLNEEREFLKHLLKEKDILSCLSFLSFAEVVDETLLINFLNFLSQVSFDLLL